MPVPLMSQMIDDAMAAAVNRAFEVMVLGLADIPTSSLQDARIKRKEVVDRFQHVMTVVMEAHDLAGEVMSRLEGVHR